MSSALTWCSNLVFKSFRSFEKSVDRITGRVGPLFVGLASLLISGCIVTFFEVVFPHQFLHPSQSRITTAAGMIWCIYIVYMMCFSYFMAITTRPGSPSDPISSPSAMRRSSLQDWIPTALCIGPFKSLAFTASSTSPEKRKGTRSKALNEIIKANESKKKANEASRGETEKNKRSNRHARVCKKCPPTLNGPPHKPERAHHCSICKKCILKFGHHCPWLNQCVGLHNERYFTLFLSYFTVGCGCVAVWGWKPFLGSLDFTREWNYGTPRAFTMTLWIITSVMFLAVGTMAVFQLWLIMKGESDVEAHDNKYYRKQAAYYSKVFRNPYDLGKSDNLALFFNVGSKGAYHWSTIFIPRLIPATSDGIVWEKAKGWETDWQIEEELTDEEDMSEDEIMATTTATSSAVH